MRQAPDRIHCASGSMFVERPLAVSSRAHRFHPAISRTVERVRAWLAKPVRYCMSKTAVSGIRLANLEVWNINPYSGRIETIAGREESQEPDCSISRRQDRRFAARNPTLPVSGQQPDPIEIHPPKQFRQ